MSIQVWSWFRMGKEELPCLRFYFSFCSLDLQLRARRWTCLQPRPSKVTCKCNKISHCKFVYMCLYLNYTLSVWRQRDIASLLAIIQWPLAVCINWLGISVEEYEISSVLLERKLEYASLPTLVEADLRLTKYCICGNIYMIPRERYQIIDQNKCVYRA